MGKRKKGIIKLETARAYKYGIFASAALSEIKKRHEIIKENVFELGKMLEMLEEITKHFDYFIHDNFEDDMDYYEYIQQYQKMKGK